MIVWTTLKINLFGQMKVAWPGLDQQVFITLYGQPYAAVWTFQPLATGTAILVATVITALLGPGRLRGLARRPCKPHLEADAPGHPDRRC